MFDVSEIFLPALKGIALYILILTLLLPVLSLFWRKANAVLYEWKHKRQIEIVESFDTLYVDTDKMSNGMISAAIILHGKMDLADMKKMILDKVILSKTETGIPWLRHAFHEIVSVNGCLLWMLDSEASLENTVTLADAIIPKNHHELQKVLTNIINSCRKPLVKVFILPLSNNFNNCECGQHFAIFYVVHHSIQDGIKGIACILGLSDDTKTREEFLAQNMLDFSERNYPLSSFKEWLVCRFLSPYYVFRYFQRFDSPNEFRKIALSGKRVLRFRTHLSLSDVKTIKDFYSATVNDIVVASVAGALRSFFLRKTSTIPKRVSAIIPINMARRNVNVKWCNDLSIAVVQLPLHEYEPSSRVLSIKKKMREVKSSLANWSIYLAMKYELSYVPLTLGRWCTCLISNLKGPSASYEVGGNKVEDFITFSANVQNIGICFCVYTFNGKLVLSMSADEAAFVSEGEPDELMDLWENEILDLKNVAKAY